MADAKQAFTSLRRLRFKRAARLVALRYATSRSAARRPRAGGKRPRDWWAFIGLRIDHRCGPARRRAGVGPFWTSVFPDRGLAGLRLLERDLRVGIRNSGPVPCPASPGHRIRTVLAGGPDHRFRPGILPTLLARNLEAWRKCQSAVSWSGRWSPSPCSIS